MPSREFSALLVSWKYYFSSLSFFSLFFFSLFAIIYGDKCKYSRIDVKSGKFAIERVSLRFVTSNLFEVSFLFVF